MQLKTVPINNQRTSSKSKKPPAGPNANSGIQPTVDATEDLEFQVGDNSIYSATCKSDNDPQFKKKIKRLVPFSIQAPLPAEGYVRLSQILNPVGPIPISESEWWARVKSGKYPKPTKHFGPGISAWNVKQIRALYPEESEQEEKKATKVGGE